MSVVTSLGRKDNVSCQTLAWPRFENDDNPRPSATARPSCGSSSHPGGLVHPTKRLSLHGTGAGLVEMNLNRMTSLEYELDVVSSYKAGTGTRGALIKVGTTTDDDHCGEGSYQLIKPNRTGDFIYRRSTRARHANRSSVIVLQVAGSQMHRP